MLENEHLRIYVDTYPGDEAWYNLLAAFDIKEGDHPDSISEIIALMKNHSNNVEKWMNSQSGLFDGLSANQVLKFGEEGITAVKAAVMRMP
jgi:hypothetical protein